MVGLAKGLEVEVDLEELMVGSAAAPLETLVVVLEVVLVALTMVVLAAALVGLVLMVTVHAVVVVVDEVISPIYSFDCILLSQ